MLQKTEFEFLYKLKQNKMRVCTQREISESMGISLGKANKLIHELASRCLINSQASSYTITKAGIEALKPYKVNNAVIMAAGMSSRFAPLSYEKPKGLLTVKGEILIEREIRQLQKAGIKDITVVVGYMKEKFFYLEEKFNIKIIVNEDYYRYNNTSTLIKVLDRLSNTYICSSDNYFVDNVFEEYVYQAYYSAVYSAGDTDEYCLSCDAHGRIKSVTIGGSNSWYMLGHVYFDNIFSKKFTRILKKEYVNQKTREHLWENLYMRYIKELDLYIKKYDSGKVLEFDSLDELRHFDKEYINNADSGILRNICRVLDCEIKDIVSIVAINAGITNTSFKFMVNGQEYVYRHPGNGTEKYINRNSEAESMKIAFKLGLDDTFIYMDSAKGWKISKYIEEARELDYHNISEVSAAVSMMKILHNQNIKSEFDFGLWDKTQKFIGQLKALGKTNFDGFDDLLSLITKVNNEIKSDGYGRRCLCHNDCYSPNFLLDKNNKMFLIDWEYSGNDDPASDLGTFICCSGYSYNESLEIIKLYNPKILDNDKELAHYIGYIAEASYYWYIWALYQETRGNSAGSWLYMWYKNSKIYGKKTLELLGKWQE